MKYAKYKETGISWLPEVPDGWEVVSLARLLKKPLQYGASEAGDIEQTGKSVRYVRITDITLDGKLKEDGCKYLDFDKAKNYLLSKGDVLLARSGATVGKAYIFNENIKACYAGYLIKASVNQEKVLPEFLFYYTQTSQYEEWKSRIFIQSTIQNISANKYAKMTLPVPTKEEQVMIVSYLDDKCSKVDRLVEAKTKQIELFKELRQSIIAEAVTKGIDGCKTFKPTNIPWLPEVPETWEVRRARYLFKKEQRPTREGDEIVTAFRDGQVTLRKNRRISGFTEATDYSHYQGIRKGDLIIHQMDAFAGCAGVSDSDGMGTPVLSACTPKKSNVDVYFFAHIVRTMGLNGFIQSLARGIRERSADFRFENFARQYLPLPPLAEQKRIVAYLDEKCAKIDTLVAKIEDEVVKLKEYRERLVADVVTGQRKVVK